MPELAEVAWFAKQWNPGLGFEVTEVRCHPKARIYRLASATRIQGGLTGLRMNKILTRGKQMTFGFGKAHLGLHLGMTGSLLLKDAGYIPERHDHLVIRQSGRSLVFRDPRMFGVLRLEGSGHPQWLRSAPPEVVSDGFTKVALEGYARRRGGAPLKSFLLQQEMFPGIGNWMADEILWRGGFYPGERVGTLEPSQIETIWRESRQVSRAALSIIGSRGDDPPKSWLFPHRWRPGGKCPKDGAVLCRQKFGGRTTAWCPTCQAPQS